jgi:CO/xanthine dehydrogenase Mo-binding subunit
MLERVLDIAADELDIDPVEIRRRNYLQPSDFPLTTLTGAAYDSGDYERALDRAVALAGAAGADPALARQAASALYHLTSAAAMAWEAARIEDPLRLALAGMVLRHRVLPRDPLAAEDDPVPEGLLAKALA